MFLLRRRLVRLPLLECAHRSISVGASEAVLNAASALTPSGADEVKPTNEEPVVGAASHSRDERFARVAAALARASASVAAASSSPSRSANSPSLGACLALCHTLAAAQWPGERVRVPEAFLDQAAGPQTATTAPARAEALAHAAALLLHPHCAVIAGNGQPLNEAARTAAAARALRALFVADHGQQPALQLLGLGALLEVLRAVTAVAADGSNTDDHVTRVRASRAAYLSAVLERIETVARRWRWAPYDARGDAQAHAAPLYDLAFLLNLNGAIAAAMPALQKPPSAVLVLVSRLLCSAIADASCRVRRNAGGSAVAAAARQLRPLAMSHPAWSAVFDALVDTHGVPPTDGIAALAQVRRFVRASASEGKATASSSLGGDGPTQEPSPHALTEANTFCFLVALRAAHCRPGVLTPLQVVTLAGCLSPAQMHRETRPADVAAVCALARAASAAVRDGTVPVDAMRLSYLVDVASVLQRAASTAFPLLAQPSARDASVLSLAAIEAVSTHSVAAGASELRAAGAELAIAVAEALEGLQASNAPNAMVVRPDRVLSACRIVAAPNAAAPLAPLPLDSHRAAAALCRLLPAPAGGAAADARKVTLLAAQLLCAACASLPAATSSGPYAALVHDPALVAAALALDVDERSVAEVVGILAFCLVAVATSPRGATQSDALAALASRCAARLPLLAASPNVADGARREAARDMFRVLVGLVASGATGYLQIASTVWLLACDFCRSHCGPMTEQQLVALSWLLSLRDARSAALAHSLLRAARGPASEDIPASLIAKRLALVDRARHVAVAAPGGGDQSPANGDPLATTVGDVRAAISLADRLTERAIVAIAAPLPDAPDALVAYARELAAYAYLAFDSHPALLRSLQGPDRDFECLARTAIAVEPHAPQLTNVLLAAWAVYVLGDAAAAPLEFEQVLSASRLPLVAVVDRTAAALADSTHHSTLAMYRRAGAGVLRAVFSLQKGTVPTQLCGLLSPVEAVAVRALLDPAMKRLPNPWADMRVATSLLLAYSNELSLGRPQQPALEEALTACAHGLPLPQQAKLLCTLLRVPRPPVSFLLGLLNHPTLLGEIFEHAALGDALTLAAAMWSRSGRPVARQPVTSSPAVENGDDETADVPADSTLEMDAEAATEEPETEDAGQVDENVVASAAPDNGAAADSDPIMPYMTLQPSWLDAMCRRVAAADVDAIQHSVEILAALSHLPGVIVEAVCAKLLQHCALAVCLRLLIVSGHLEGPSHSTQCEALAERAVALRQHADDDMTETALRAFEGIRHLELPVRRRYSLRFLGLDALTSPEAAVAFVETRVGSAASPRVTAVAIKALAPFVLRAETGAIDFDLLSSMAEARLLGIPFVADYCFPFAVRQLTVAGDAEDAAAQEAAARQLLRLGLKTIVRRVYPASATALIAAAMAAMPSAFDVELVTDLLDAATTTLRGAAAEGFAAVADAFQQMLVRGGGASLSTMRVDTVMRIARTLQRLTVLRLEVRDALCAGALRRLPVADAATTSQIIRLGASDVALGTALIAPALGRIEETALSVSLEELSSLLACLVVVDDPVATEAALELLTQRYMTLAATATRRFLPHLLVLEALARGGAEDREVIAVACAVLRPLVRAMDARHHATLMEALATLGVDDEAALARDALRELSQNDSRGVQHHAALALAAAAELGLGYDATLERLFGRAAHGGELPPHATERLRIAVTYYRDQLPPRFQQLAPA